MYLTKLLLNPRHADVRRDLASLYEMHRTLMRGADEAEERLLFRVEPLENGATDPVVLVQALSEPDWSRLPPGYLLRMDGPRSFEPRFRGGEPLRFRLAANPTIKKDGKRVPLIHGDPENDAGHPTYWSWLERKAGRNGFALVHNAEDQRCVQDATFYTAPRRGKGHRYRKHQIPHFGVRFDGLLRVTDPEALVEAVRRGIGPAKAFGFGLLSLARVR